MDELRDGSQIPDSGNQVFPMHIRNAIGGTAVDAPRERVDHRAEAAHMIRTYALQIGHFGTRATSCHRRGLLPMRLDESARCCVVET